MATKRFKVTDKTRYWIQVLSEENGLTPVQIRDHPKVQRSDGKKLDLKVCECLNRKLTFQIFQLKEFDLNSFEIELRNFFPFEMIPNQKFTFHQTIKRWIERSRETGDVKLKPKTGRKRLLEPADEQRLVRAIEKDSKRSYRSIKETESFPCSVRTLNDYAIRNGYSRLTLSLKIPVWNPNAFYGSSNFFAILNANWNFSVRLQRPTSLFESHSLRKSTSPPAADSSGPV